MTSTRPRRGPKVQVKESLESLCVKQWSRENPYKAGFLERYPPCTLADHQGGKKNCTNNPHCLYGLGEKKEGIWANKNPLIAALGEDPKALQRGYGHKPGGGSAAGGKKCAGGKKRGRVRKVSEADDPEDLEAQSEVPTGLTNLGATCYLNVLLQAMYFNKHFRKAVYEFQEPPASEGTSERVMKMVVILKELRRVFAHMHLGRARDYNPKEFANLLSLDRGEQQDPQEFHRLFMQKIEECFGALRDSSLAGMLRSLHRGKLKYVTKCRECENESIREETYDELEVYLEGRDSVIDCLTSYLKKETLEGDNQYFCGRCKAKRDATRGVNLAELPKILNIHLMRYLYIDGQKRKINDAIKLNEILDFREIITGAGEEDEGDDGAAVTAVAALSGDVIYDLVGVMHHKGGSASHGHYTAEYKHDESGKWWTFDDTEVKEGQQQLHVKEKGEQAKAKKAAATATSSSPAASPAPIEIPSSEDGDHSSVGAPSPRTGGGRKRKQSTDGAADTGGKKEEGNAAAAAAAAPEGPRASADAYCLIYVKRGSEAGLKDTELANLLPEDVKAEVKQANARLVGLVQDYQRSKRQLEEAVQKRRSNYDNYFCSDGSPPTVLPGDEYYWVPTVWLKGWVTGIKPTAEGEEKEKKSTTKSGKSGSREHKVDMTTVDQETTDTLADPSSLVSYTLHRSGMSVGLKEDVVDMTVDQETTDAAITIDEDETEEGSGKEDAAADAVVKEEEKAKKIGLESLRPPNAKVFSDQILLAPYICSHSNPDPSVGWHLDPNKTCELKAVPREVFYMFVEETGHQPDYLFFAQPDKARESGTYCRLCIEAYLQAQENLTHRAFLADRVLDALSLPEPQQPEAGDAHILSKRWENMFKKECEKASKALLAGELAEKALLPLSPSDTTTKEEKKEEGVVEVMGVDDEEKEGAASSSSKDDGDEESKASPVATTGKKGDRGSEEKDNDPEAAAAIAAVEEAERKEKAEKEGLDPYINNAITCDHEQLYGTAKTFRYITNFGWSQLHNMFPMAKVYLSGREPCTQCKQESVEEKDKRKAMKEERDRESSTKDLKSLAKRKTVYPPSLKLAIDDTKPFVDQSYMLVDRLWLANWKTYIQTLDSENKKPGPPTNDIALRCPHQPTHRLNPPILLIDFIEFKDLLKAAEASNKMPETGEADLITVKEWQDLLAGFSEEDKAQCQAYEVRLTRGVGEDEHGNALIYYEIKGHPEWCEDCAYQKSKDREASRNEFAGKLIKVMMLKEGDVVPQASLPAAPTSGRRNSARSTRGARKGDNHSIDPVSSSDTVQAIKWRVSELVDIENPNVRLYANGRELQASLSLAQEGVTSETTLYARCVEPSEGRPGIWDTLDVTEAMGGGSGGGGGGGANGSSNGNGTPYRREQGFQGTFLAQCPVSAPPPPPSQTTRVMPVDDEGDHDSKPTAAAAATADEEAVAVAMSFDGEEDDEVQVMQVNGGEGGGGTSSSSSSQRQTCASSFSSTDPSVNGGTGAPHPPIPLAPDARAKKVLAQEGEVDEFDTPLIYLTDEMEAGTGEEVIGEKGKEDPGQIQSAPQHSFPLRSRMLHASTSTPSSISVSSLPLKQRGAATSSPARKKGTIGRGGGENGTVGMDDKEKVEKVSPSRRGVKRPLSTPLKEEEREGEGHAGKKMNGGGSAVKVEKEEEEEVVGAGKGGEGRGGGGGYARER